MNQKSSTTIVNKALYAILFLVVVPVILWLWATYTADLVKAPVMASETAGYALVALGLFLMAWGMFALKRYGKGLPMNAFPPLRFVTNGPYQLFRHPIYWGFGIFLVGFFISIKSASGLWLVTPITILAMMALVRGYEAIDLKKRFPDATLTTVLDLPDKTAESPGAGARLAALFWVLAALFVSNIIVSALAGDVPARWGALPFEAPDAYWSLFSLVFILATPLILQTNTLLRTWAIGSLLAIGIAAFMAVLYPGLCAQYLPDRGNAAYFVPVFLVLMALKAFFAQSRWLGLGMGVAALGCIGIQLALSRSAALHAGGAVLVFLLAANHLPVWLFLRKGAEKIANSWHEWLLGNVRVINHGFYVGAGAFLGILLAGMLVGDAYAWAILMFAVVVTIAAALWAQIIEGSEKLKRPFGYYGALVGIIFASLVVWAMGYHVWIIIGVISVVMPWVQAIGRFRCLVNGCCHGSKVNDPLIGIRYFHPRSRVCSISHLKGEYLHPTQLYSMLWLFGVGFVLLSLWYHDYAPPFIFGLYLILNGIGRFVEEAYRGEVQTPVLKGLRLYQWMAILSVLVGILMTVIRVDTLVETPVVGWKTIVAALVGGLFITFAMGIDFPRSNARFSRLV